MKPVVKGASSLRFSKGDLSVIAAFVIAIAVANAVGGVPWPVWIGTLVAPVVLGSWQIRQGNISKARVLEEVQSELNKRNRELSEANINEALRQAARIMSPNDPNGRANVMLIGSDNRLHIAYHFNMAEAPDLGVRFDKYQGCTGHAWALGEQAFADLKDIDEAELRRTWKLSPDQINLTAAVKSIICTPIRDPRNRESIAGVFSVDSTLPLTQTRFDGHETAEEGLKVAEVIARLLITGGII